MSTDADIIGLVDEAFEEVSKPEHFTNFLHCQECAEHDATLREHDRETLRREHVNKPGWDPLCFCSAHGKAYYMPSLVRFSLAEPGPGGSQYWEQLLFHLEADGPNNELITFCDQHQRNAVAAFLAHLLEARTETVEASSSLEELLRVHGYWSNAA